jgi:hypothetical protein
MKSKDQVVSITAKELKVKSEKGKLSVSNQVSN